MTRIEAAFRLIYILSLRDIVSLDELSHELDMSKRSIQRLRLDLEEAGYHIETVKGPNGGYRLLNNPTIPAAHLSPSEERVLKKSLSLLAQEYRHDFGPDLASALGKLTHSVQEESLTVVPNFQTVKLNVDEEVYRKHMLLAEKAIDQHLKIHLRYQKNRREERNYLFEPYALIVINGQWYLTGFDQNNRYLTLKMIRVTDLKISEQTFRYDEQYLKKVQKFEQGHRIKPVEASIRIHDMDYISEYIWGEKQEIEWIDEFSFRLKAVFPNLQALKQFILRGGSKMYVEKPKEVQAWIQEEAKKISKLYS